MPSFRRFLPVVASAAALALPAGVALAATPPATPTGLHGSAVPGSGIHLRWSPVGGAGEYVVLRAGPTDAGFASIGTTTSTGFVDLGVSPYTAYRYEVVAAAPPQSSPPSAPVVVTDGGAAPAGWDASTAQPLAPFNATFYYGWFANPATDGAWDHWNASYGSTDYHNPPSNWASHYLPDLLGTGDPSTALYSSADPTVINDQLRLFAAAHQTVGLYSWWGPAGQPWQNSPVGTPADEAAIDHNFASILAATTAAGSPYPNFRWAIYYEPEGYYDPTVATISSDLRYILANYASQPGYLHIGGKPVVFVYNAQDPGSGPNYWQSDLSRWTQVRTDMAKAGTPFYISMKADPLWNGASPSAMDSWHEYAPANPAGSVRAFSSYVSPGFWLEGSAPRLARNPATFDANVAAMAAAGRPWNLTETWNEWQEGTAVEPGSLWNWASDPSASPASPAQATPVAGGDYGSTYLDALACHLPDLTTAGTGSGYTPPPPSGCGVTPTRPTAAACPPGQVAPAPFTDVSADDVWRTDISCIARYGFSGGTTATTYTPTRSVTRAEMAVFVGRLAKAAGLTWNTSPHGFTDLGGLPAAFTDAINALANAGVVSGVTATSYDPGGVVTRAQMAKFLGNALATTGAGAATSAVSHFVDTAGVASLRPYIDGLAADGVVNGVDGVHYDPQAPVSRDQMAGFLARTAGLEVAAGRLADAYPAAASTVGPAMQQVPVGGTATLTLTGADITGYAVTGSCTSGTQQSGLAPPAGHAPATLSISVPVGSATPDCPLTTTVSYANGASEAFTNTVAAS